MRWTHELTGNILWNCNVEQLQLMFLVTYNERRFYQKWKSDITCLVFMIFNGNRKKCISTFVPNSVSCMLNKHFDYWSIIDRPSALNFWIWYRIYTKAQGATSGFEIWNRYSKFNIQTNQTNYTYNHFFFIETKLFEDHSYMYLLIDNFVLTTSFLGSSLFTCLLKYNIQFLVIRSKCTSKPSHTWILFISSVKIRLKTLEILDI